MVHLQAGAATSAGRVRDANEDAVLVAPPVFGVADGMGGHAAGEVASRLAVDTLRDATAGRQPTLDEVVRAVQEANRVIVDASDADPARHGMGTTFTAVALVAAEPGPRLGVVNVGDSRAYVFSTGVLRLLTRDHTYVEELVAAGEITPEEARFHPHRNIVTRALGVDETVEVDAWALDPVPGDRYLVCSDGLTNEVDDPTIAQILASEADPQRAAERLVNLANEMGGRDNSTVVVVDVVDVLDVAGTDEASGSAPPSGVGVATGSATEAATQAATGGGATPTAATTGEVPDTLSPDATALPATPSTTPERLLADTTASTEPGPLEVGGWLEPSDDDLSRSPVPPPVRPPEVATPAPPRKRHRRLTAMVVVFVGLVVVVLAVAVFGIVRAGRSGWFVGFSGDQVALYQGRPEGLLWVDPTLERTYLLTRDDLAPEWEERVERNPTFSSREAAENWVAALATNPSAVPALATTTTVPTTTLPPSTAPPVTLAPPVQPTTEPPTPPAGAPSGG